MPVISLNIPAGPAAELAAIYGYAKADGSLPTNAEILQRVKDELIGYLQIKVRERRHQDALTTAQAAVNTADILIT